jgi:hypothetical protein
VAKQIHQLWWTGNLDKFCFSFFANFLFVFHEDVGESLEGFSLNSKEFLMGRRKWKEKDCVG